MGLGCQQKARKTQEWRWFLQWHYRWSDDAILFLLGILWRFDLIWAVLTGWKGVRTPKLIVQYLVAAALAIAIVVPVTKSFASSYKTGSVPEVGLMNYVTQNHGQPVTDPPSARLETMQLVTPRREAQSTKTRRMVGVVILAGLP